MKRHLLKLGHQAWRLLPRDLRRRSMTQIAAALARKPDHLLPASSHGVVVAGDMEGPNGLAESARILHQVIAAAGLARGFIPLGLPSVVPSYHLPVPRNAALLAVVNAPILPVALLRYKKDFLAGRRVIGMWAWELPVLPPDWRYGAKFVHELWAPSQFTADVLESLLPGRVRMVPYPLAEVALPVSGNRASLGLPADRLIVLTTFNLASSMVRKNPLGAIAAFKAAFGDSRDHLFVLKISASQIYPDDVKIIQAAIGDAGNIKLITHTMSEPELRGLIAASDIVLSLHRSEGFGLIPATAMLLGRPVVATNWSGNLAFMNTDVSALISYKLIPAIDPRGTYELPAAVWAEPDTEDAAAWLRRLGDDAALRQSMGIAGQAYARQSLGKAPLLTALAANGIITPAAQTEKLVNA